MFPFNLLFVLLSTTMVIHILMIPLAASRQHPRFRNSGDNEHRVANPHDLHRHEKRSSTEETSSSVHGSGSMAHHRHSRRYNEHCNQSSDNGFLRLGNDSPQHLIPPRKYPVCDWCCSVNYNPNRTPERIHEARCCSPDHRVTNDTVQIPELMNKPCETIYYNVLVYMKSTHLDSELNVHETVKVEEYRAAVGCTPAYPLVHRPSTS